MYKNLFVWVASLVRLCLYMAPYSTLFVILGTVLSQVLLLVTFLLPLKVLILIGSDKFGMIEGFYPEITKNQFVVIFGVITVTFYLLALILEKMVGDRLQAEGLQIMSMVSPIPGFNKSNETAQKVYEGLLRAVSGGVFALLATATVFFVYPRLFWLAAIYLCFAAISMYVVYRVNSRKLIEGRFIFELPAHVGFFIAFFWVSYDMLVLSGVSVFVAIVGVLLLRQGFSRLFRSLREIFRLWGQRNKINSIFFEGYGYRPDLENSVKEYWALFEEPTLTKMLSDIIPTRCACGEFNVTWEETGINDVSALSVEPADGSGGGEEKYLVKIFSARREVYFANEKFLYENEVDLPVLLPFVSAGEYESAYYLMADVSGVDVMMKELLRDACDEIALSLLLFKPSEYVVSHYLGKKRSLGERLCNEIYSRLSLAARSQSQKVLLDRLAEMKPEVKSFIDQLPLQYHNPNINYPNIYTSKDDQVDGCKYRVANWHRWDIVPVGYGLKCDQQKLGLYAERAASRFGGNGLHFDPAKALSLGMLGGKIEYLYLTERYTTALTMLPELLDHVESMR